MHGTPSVILSERLRFVNKEERDFAKGYLFNGSQEEQELVDKQDRLSVIALQCAEWGTVRRLFNIATDKALKLSEMVVDEENLEQIDEKKKLSADVSNQFRVVKTAAETLAIIQKQERVAYRLDSTPIAYTSNELDRLSTIEFIIQQPRDLQDGKENCDKG